MDLFILLMSVNSNQGETESCLQEVYSLVKKKKRVRGTNRMFTTSYHMELVFSEHHRSYKNLNRLEAIQICEEKLLSCNHCGLKIKI